MIAVIPRVATLACVLVSGVVACPGTVRADPRSIERAEEIERIQTELQAVGRRLRDRLAEARRARDIISVTCIDDRLTQLTTHRDMIVRRSNEWFRARLAGDDRTAEHAWAVISVLEGRVRELAAEGALCMGQDLFEVGASAVALEIDGDGEPRPPARNAQERPTPPPTAPELPDVADAPTGAPQQQLIYRASFRLAVFEVAAAQASIEAIVADLDGFVHEQTTTSVTVRVPAARFREAVERIGGVGDVLARHVQSRDVGEEYRDLTIRLQNAQAVRRRLEQVLAQADTVEDTLAVERELERITLEIERIQGRLRYLTDRIELSTIRIGFRPAPREGEVDPGLFRLPFPWLQDLGLRSLLDLSEAPAAPAPEEPYDDEWEDEAW